MADGERIYDWFYFFKNLSKFAVLPSGLERFRPIADAAKTEKIKDLETLVSYMKSLLSDEERQLLKESSYELGVYEGEEQGEERGVERGRTEQTLKDAKSLKQLGVPIETLSQGLGLPMETLEAL